MVHAAAQPITVVIQASLLGRHAGVNALGAFGAVSISSGFFTRVFNFLVDGVSAKTGKSVGMHAWAELGSRVRMSLGFALISGLVAACLFALAKIPISNQVLELSPEVIEEANAYWWLRTILIPITLLNMSQNGILQGFRQMHIVAGINTIQALAEMGGSALLLKGIVNIGINNKLLAMGIWTVITQILQFFAGFVAMLFFPPSEARGQFDLWKVIFLRLENYRDDEEEENPLYLGLVQDSDTEHHDGCMKNAEETKEKINGQVNKKAENHDTFHDSLSSLYHADQSTSMPSNSDSESTVDGRTNEFSCEKSVPLREMCTETPANLEEESLLDFVSDGLNMFVRSMILQLTFFMALVAASRLGTPFLAAHSIVSQLWSLISYVVDGFAAAGIVLGSRLAAQAHDCTRAADAKKHLQKIIRRVLSAGFVAGIVASTVFYFKENEIISMFTSDKATIGVLHSGTWLILTISQPVNGLVFVYDGLMYASQSFKFIRNYMILGFLIIFCPIWAGQLAISHSLAGVWAAKSAMNIWRVGGAAYLIHWIFMSEFDELARRTMSASSMYDPEIAEDC